MRERVMPAAAVIRDVQGMYQLQLWASSDLEPVLRFLRRHRVRVHGDGDAAALSVPGALTAAHEQSEIAGCVAIWNALNPATPIELRLS